MTRNRKLLLTPFQLWDSNDIDIYKSWELYNVPTAIVTKKYKISTSNLHKIVCTVNKIISRYGKELLNAA